MDFKETNFYTQDENLILFMKEALHWDNYNFCSLNKVPDPDAENIFIVKNIPEKIYEYAKYILITDTPETLSLKEIELLYDIWPEKLTPPLMKFFFGRLHSQLQAEIQKSATEYIYQKRLLEMAHQDYLTGLKTRWYLQDYVQKNDDKEIITCIYFDLDNFKELNDTFGHQAGDKALASVAEIMRDSFPDGCTARMGGDEFMVVLVGERKVKDTETRVNFFMKNLSDYCKRTETMKNLSVSAGISQRANKKKTFDTLIHESDTALYAAKKAGKNCCIVYQDSLSG